LLKHTIFEENFASYPNLGVCSGEEEEENERIAYDEPGQEKCPPGIFWVFYVWEYASGRRGNTWIRWYGHDCSCLPAANNKGRELDHTLQTYNPIAGLLGLGF
jgi:hypothetical protein